ncbi:Interferon-related developmental regulator 1 [Orchesella cincta]|uniref:Interferon-related developmental regulator 1 n=1 Tax=Orchesella cincta TaxID=48709 RepID=A0A1D2NHV0_ORCCI|nr:Interferon-related developmental regulator 1 [Orchesella cincta]
MPKPRSGDKKGKAGTPKKGKSRRGAYGMSDDDSVNGDSASVVSMNSERGSYEDYDNGNGEEHDEGVTIFGVGSREAMEEKVAEAIDGIIEKSASIRTSSLSTLVSLLSQNFNPDLILGRRETLRDHLEKIFKRGQGSDQAVAANVHCLALLQIGALDSDMATEDFNALKPFLQSLVLDHTASVAARVKCCEALCFGAFISEGCSTDVMKIITVLEPLFGCGTKSKRTLSEDENSAHSDGAKSVKIPKNSSTALAAAAMSGWSLLITLMSDEYLNSRAYRWIAELQSLLDQPDLEVRLGAGEALAIVVDLCGLTVDDSEVDTDYSSAEESDVDSSLNGHQNGHRKKTSISELIAKLRQLSVESHKYRAKKDRRQQRHSFRDFLHAVEEGSGPGQVMKFGVGEVLEVDTWGKKKQYDAICQVVGAGINRHLIENTLVRSILELGTPKPVVSDGGIGAKQAKSERQYMNAVNFKARCVSRGKAREYRMATLEDY